MMALSNIDDLSFDGLQTIDDEIDISSNSSDSGSEDGEGSTDENFDGLDEVGDPHESSDDQNAEEVIEGDFDRIVKNIRLTDTGSSSGLLTKDWDFNIQDKEAEFRDDLRAASGIGRKRKKGRTAGPTLSPQVRSLIGDGNQAYVDCQIPETIRIMQEVIRIEPRAASAWSVLAQCYEDLHQEQKALQLRIMAAHLRHDADEWYRLAEQSKRLGYSQQALYCYRKVYSLDPSNVDALWDRASLAKETGEFKTARNAFLGILKRFPYDLTVLDELRTILIELSDLELCTSLFKEAFEHYQSVYPSGSAPNPNSQGEIPGGGFGLMEILVLADLYNTLGEHEHAVNVIKRGCRWLQGRGDQRYWDMCDDDREYDLAPEEGRSDPVRTGEVEAGMFPLDVNARHRLAVARIKMGDMEEGKIHANIVLSQDVLDYAPLFAEIADAYFEREMYAEARPIYETLGSDAATSSMYVLLQTAACLRMVGELREAAEVYEHIKAADPTHNEAKMKLAEIYEILNEPRKALELVYEVIDSRRKRPKDGGGQSTDAGNTTTSLFEEKAKAKSKTGARAHNRLTPTQLRELEAEKEKEVLRGYRRVTDLWAATLGKGDHQPEAEHEWMLEAEKLVDTFRETRNLFLTSRTQAFRGMFPRRTRAAKQNLEEEEERMASRLHLDLEHDALTRKSKGIEASRKVDVFRGVSFDDWLRVFMQYAFLLTKRNQYNLADEILRHILVSNVYQDRSMQVKIRLTLLTCAIATQHYAVVVEQCRKLIIAYQFNNEPQRLLLVSLSSGLRPTDSFITSTLQKHLFREIKIADLAVRNPEALKWNNLNKRYAPMSTGSNKSGEADEVPDEEMDDTVDVGREETMELNSSRAGLPALPTTQNPATVAIYGQVCNAAKSYQSAIFYLLHAYDYCPDDPMICLSLSIASIGRAMQRQADNRHHLIAQAMAFLSRYRILRRAMGENMEEVEYNFGRAFHQLGLFSHAARHYERSLEIAEKRTADKGFAREAAYNLASIYVMTGATPLAQALYRRWLSL